MILPANDRRLDELTAEAAELAGAWHWQTGQLGSAHFTVRALEGYRAHVPAGDAACGRYLQAMARTPSGSFRMRVTGLTLTPGSVMAAAEPVGSSADAFMDALTAELGADAWFEEGRRDIWYVNLLHFTGPIVDPGKLIEWVRERRTAEVGELLIPKPALVRFRLVDGERPHMRPVLVNG